MTLDLSPHEKLRLLRNRRGMTQGGLARKVNEEKPLQITYQMQISRIEQGKEPPSEDLKRKLEEVLGANIWPKENEKAAN